MESRTGRPGRDADCVGDLDQGQAGVVMQDEDGPMLDRQAPEGPFEDIPIDDGEQ